MKIYIIYLFNQSKTGKVNLLDAVYEAGWSGM